MTIPGIYALFRLDGSKISPPEATAFGFDPGSAASALVRATDPIEPNAVQMRRKGGSLDLLIGHVDEAEALARRLSISPEAPPLALALAAHDRYGNDLAREMLGGWTLVRWDDATRQLTIAKSINATYTLFLARTGDKIALAPELPLIGRLPWIDRAVDEASLFDVLASFRMAAADLIPSIVRNVRVVPRSRVVVLDRGGERVIRVDPALPSQPFRGSFDDALAEIEALTRTIVRDVVSRSSRIGLSLSGGLDSTLLTWIAAQEKRAGEPLPLFCYAYEPHRGIEGEVKFARAVADRLGEPLDARPASKDINLFQPRVALLRSQVRPPRGPFPFMERAIEQFARDHGVTHLLNGGSGELTVTSAVHPSSTYRRLRNRAHRAWYWLIAPGERVQWPEGAFSTWLAPRLLDRLPADWIRQRRIKSYGSIVRRPGQSWGYPDGLDTLFEHENLYDIVPGQLRSSNSFTDIRLLRLFAGMPIDFARANGVDRSIARHMLIGRVPEAIRLRPKGPAAALDYRQRLRENVGWALARIPLYRRTGIGEWLDLDRIETQLRGERIYDRAHRLTTFRTHFGVMAAEFFLWWQAGCPAEEDRP